MPIKPMNLRSSLFAESSGKLNREKGFALVVTLTLMVLLLIIALGLLSLSSVALRTANSRDGSLSARANARMAMMIAIGELQREMGPDSRISAPHDVGGQTGGQAHWTAVYDAWKSDPAGGNAPLTPESRIPKFRGWLVSGAGVATGDMALMVGSGSLGDDFDAEDRVEAPMQEVTTGSKQGRIAWWVSDESAKAKVNAGPEFSEDPAFGLADAMFDVQSPPNVGHRAFAELADMDWKDGKRGITVSVKQLNLAAGLGSADLVGRIHDLTVHSAGVLSDVSTGRLKRDLSNLLLRDVTEIEDKPLYLADGRMNRFAITKDGAVSNAPNLIQPWRSSANTANEWGINLEELSLFHNLHREITWGSEGPRLVSKATREEVVRDRFYLYRRPVIEAVQFILSLRAVANGAPGNYKMEMMLDGMVALSNPNDVPLEWPADLILPVQLQNVPYGLDWKITKADGTSKNQNSVDAPSFGLFIGRVGGGRNISAAGFTLEPGEAATFGSTTASGQHLDLLPGFVPGGGVRMTGWNLKATGLKADDKIDFEFIKGDTGFSSTYTYYNVWIGDRKTGGNAKGWQIGAGSLSSGGDINSTEMNQLLLSPIRPPQVRPVSDFVNKPQPVMMINFLMNVEQSSGAVPPDAFASRPFQFNEPAASWGGLSPTTIETARHSTQMLITAEPMNYQFRTLAAGAGGRNIYHGGGRQPNLGGSFNVIKRRIPIAPPMSLGAFENAIASGFTGRFSNSGPAIGPDPYPADAVALCGRTFAWPLTAKAIGNSWSTPFLSSDKVYRASTGNRPDTKGATDHSWMANTALWDSWFLSGIVDGTGAGSSPWLEDSRSPRAQFLDLAEGTGTLRNRRFLYHAHKPSQEALDELFDGNLLKPAALNKLPSYLLVDGAFNVNSTSAAAWKAFLASVRDQELLVAGGGKMKFEHPFGTLGYAANTATSGTAGDWAGLRDISDTKIGTLAAAIVTEVKSRGPFLNLADFVNRRPDASDPGHRSLGALQSAITLSGLNDRFTGVGRDAQAADFQPLAGTDTIADEPMPSRAIGSAGYLSQAALLTAIGSQITVRGDTFTIRAYGDHRDASGDIVARAWCEAVVQRVPEYLDPADEPEAQEGWPSPSDSLAPANLEFGRKFEIRSFQWLAPSEV